MALVENALRHRVLEGRLGSGLFSFEVAYKGKPTEVLRPVKQTAASAIGGLQGCTLCPGPVELTQVL